MVVSINHQSSQWFERVAIVSCCCFVIALIRLTLWKENEFFWYNFGGYPIWLRESVQLLYYPYLLFTAMCLCIVSRSVLGRLFRELCYSRVWGILLAAWILFFSNCGLLVANNLINIFENKPLHHHEPIELQLEPLR
jgi:hypothetical protein